MRIVHFADIHLGYRQYHRLTPAGINQREADIAAALVQLVDKTIELEPDIVLVGGDVFHQVRPTNPAILHGFQQFARLVRALPDAIVVMVAGNHDVPRSRDTVCILRLFAQLGIHVVDAEPKRLHFPERELAIFAMPDVKGYDPEIAPEPTVRYNVALMHVEVEGTLPSITGRERTTTLVPVSAVAHPDWDYVALGHYHVCRQVAPRAWYCGSTEYTSTNPWGEMREETGTKLGGKGFLEFDLDSGESRFHRLELARAFVDLPAIEGQGLGAEDLDARIAAAVDKCPGGLDDKVVRLVVRDVPRHLARDLNHRAIREYRKRALHFNLDVRPPEAVRSAVAGAPGGARSLAATLRERLKERPLDAELDRARFVALGLEYLSRADATEAATAQPVAEVTPP